MMNLQQMYSDIKTKHVSTKYSKEEMIVECRMNSQWGLKKTETIWNKHET